MVPYSVNIAVRKGMIYCVVINKDKEMSYFTEKIKLLNEGEKNYEIFYIYIYM